MYRNYGDQNFFKYGRLIETEDNGKQFNILYCEPFPDEEDLYLFATLYIDIEDDWINKNEILEFSGLNSLNTYQDAILYVLACIDFYSLDNFLSTNMYFLDKRKFTHKEILNLLPWDQIPADEISFENPN